MADNSEVRISLIAAMARNRVIGLDGDMPWRLPEDLAHFKAVTMGKPIIMGRLTWESIGRPLPGRHNIVVSRTLSTKPFAGIAKSLKGQSSDDDASGIDGARRIDTVTDLETAIAVATAGANGTPGAPLEVMIIGGGQIYSEALPIACRLYLTLVDLDVEGDTWFPAYSESDWREIESRELAATETQPAMRMVTLDRR